MSYNTYDISCADLVLGCIIIFLDITIILIILFK